MYLVPWWITIISMVWQGLLKLPTSVVPPGGSRSNGSEPRRTLTGTYRDFWKRPIVSSALNWVFWKLRCRTGGQCGVVLDECLHSVLSRSAIVPVLWWLIRSHLFYTCILDTKFLPWFAFVFVEWYQRSIRVCHRAWNQNPSSKIMYFRTRSADTTMHET